MPALLVEWRLRGGQVHKTGLPVMVQMAAAKRDRAIVTTTVTAAMVSSVTMIGDSKQITAKQDQPQRTIPGKTGVNGLSALSPVVELAPEPGPATALAQLMVEMNARLPMRPKRKAAMLQLAGPTLEIGHSAPCPVEAPALRPGPSPASNPRMADRLAPSRKQSRKVKTAMCQLAGLTLVIGHNAPCHVEAPAPRPEPSLVSSPKMAESPAPRKTPSRSPSLAMPQPAGQNTLIGLHARDSAAKLEISQGAGAAFNQRLVACHAPMRQQRRRHRTVIPSDYL